MAKHETGPPIASHLFIKSPFHGNVSRRQFIQRLYGGVDVRPLLHVERDLPPDARHLVQVDLHHRPLRLHGRRPLGLGDVFDRGQARELLAPGGEDQRLACDRMKHRRASAKF